MPKKGHSLNDSPGQRARYFQLVSAAYENEKDRLFGDIAPINQWRREINLKATECYSIKEMNQTTDFDKVMLELAIIAEDMYWIDRLSSSAERRIKWVIEEQFIPDLEFLLKEPIRYSYIEGICRQAGFSVILKDCPARDMVRVMQMVDTHIRRLAKRADIELVALPSGYFRQGIPTTKARAKYRYENHHHLKHGAVA